MPDQPVREIQLGGKQLVFLFMASVVLAVAIFLLGISVGRGVQTAAGAATVATDVAVGNDVLAPLPAEMPPATETTATDLQYHGQLQGQSTPPAQPQPAPASKPAEDPPVVAEQPPVTAAPPPQEKPAAKAPVETVAKPAPAPPGGGWFVQVNAFRSRENAERQVAQLKDKNYPALISPSAGLFRVRVGPFAQRDEADRVRLRLQREEGLKPSIQR